MQSGKIIQPYFRLTAVMLIGLACAVCSGTAAAAVHGPGLDDILRSASPAEPVAVMLFLDQRLEMDEVYPVARSLPMSSRRAYVVDALQTRFNDMGSAVMTYLDSERKSGAVKLLRPLWIMNGIRLTAAPHVLAEIDARFPEVVYMTADIRRDNTLDDGWGVMEMECPRVWTQFGADGSGVIVGHKDAGLETLHPGFAGHLWINPAEDLNHNGVFDASDENGVDEDGNGYIDDLYGWGFDNDNNNVNDNPDAGGSFGHGTKTASVISANFTPCDTISVAPGAKLMVLSAFLTQGAVIEASQYAVAMGAHVISASLSFKQSDCVQYNDCPNWVAHRFVSEMELAAGLIHANSTGNTQANPVPLSIACPANCPPPAMTPSHRQHGGVSSIVGVNAYGSTGGFSNGGLGPSGWSRPDICAHPRMPFCGPDGQGNGYPAAFSDYPFQNGQLPGLLKPDIIAPTSSTSLNVGGGCSSIGGTSGATPHVGGALALIFSAFPGITPEDAYLLLVNGAIDGGPAGVDTLWGFGKVRPYNSIASGRANWGSVSGTVSSAGSPLSAARVIASPFQPVRTDQNGFYRIYLPAGTYTARFDKYGYIDASRAITVTSGQSQTVNVALARSEMMQATGVVTGRGRPLAGIPVSIPEIPLTTQTAAAGDFTLSVFEGVYEMRIGALPWNTHIQEVTVEAGMPNLQIALTPSPRALPTGPDARGYYLYDNFDAPDFVEAQYNWIEINPNAGGLPGVNLNLGADNTVVRTLPFTFQFYGAVYSQIAVSANGFVMLGGGSSNEWLEYPIPNTALPNGFLAPFYDDWEPQRGGGVWYYTDAANARVIVEWYQVPHYDLGVATFQVIIYNPATLVGPNNDGVAKYQYAAMNGRFEGIVGIENPAGTDGVQYRFQLMDDEHASPIESGRAILVSTDPTLDVERVPAAVLPQEFVLLPNYPNPFNPVTVFAWTVPHTAAVKLTLFDVLGREAAVVFEGVLQAGEHRAAFDASALSSGVYFARFEAQHRVIAARKIMLLK